MGHAAAGRHVAPLSPGKAQHRKGGGRVNSKGEKNLVESNERRQQMIATAACFRAEHRHSEPEHELQDWLDAEAAIDGAYFRVLP